MKSFLHFLSILHSYIPLIFFVLLLVTIALLRVLGTTYNPRQTEEIIGRPFLVTKYPKEVLFNQYIHYSKNITIKIESPFESSQKILPGHCIVPIRAKFPKHNNAEEHTIIDIYEYKLDHACENSLLLYLSRLKYALIDRYEKAVKFPYSALVLGMTIGYEDELTPELNKSIKIAGLSHVLVVSGYNFSLLTVLLRRIFSVFGGKFYCAIVITILLIYFLICGPEPPATRALFMSFVSLVGLVIGREVITIYLLIVGYLFFVIFDPQLASNASFNLSFTATFGLVISGWMRYITTSNIILIMNEILHINVFIFPLLLNYFGEYHLGGIIINLLVIDLIPVITLIGFIHIFTIDQILSVLLYMTISSILECVNIWQLLLEKLGMLPIYGNMTPKLVALYYLLLLCVVLLIYLWIWRFRVQHIN